MILLSLSGALILKEQNQENPMSQLQKDYKPVYAHQ